MSRFLRLQIYNANNTQVEFDNTIDTFWGIVISTARLDRKIMQSELKFGELLANMLQIQVFGLDKNINLKNRKVVLSLRYDKKVYSHLVDDNGDYIVDSDGDRLLLSAPDIVDTEKTLFTGYIDTSTMDTIKTDRTLIAYDKSYIFRDIDIATWWNTYWEAHENDAITIATFRNSLLNAFNIQYEPKVLINDNAIITNWLINVTTLKLGTILSQLCEVQCCCPNVNADEILEFVTLGSTTHDLTSNLEGLNSIWKDFTTELVTGVAVYDTSKNLAQLIGTDSNVYNLAGNVFVLSMNTQQINSVGANILNAINTIQYTPCSLNLVTSDVEHNLGDSIITSNGNSYILTQTYSGSLLINEQISSPATKPTLNAEVNSINDEFIEGQKRAKIEQTIDEFYTEYTNYANNTSSMISQMSDRIVLKVNSDGQIVQVALTADPDTATTSFKVSADNIDFIANGVMTLAANNIGIEATNFSIDKDTGLMNCAGGTIAGFNITTDALYNGPTSWSDTSHEGIYIDINGALNLVGPLNRTYIKGGQIYTDYIISAFGMFRNATIPNRIVLDASYTGNIASIYRVECTQLSVTGTKSKVVDTEDYGKRLLYCYETSSPLFGDVGEGIIAEDGKCYIWLDSIFAQTVNSDSYQVFLQKYGQGECYVTDRTANYFVVEGDSGLAFGWEIKAKQIDYEMTRLERDDSFTVVSQDYGEIAEEHLSEIRKEREVA